MPHNTELEGGTAYVPHNRLWGAGLTIYRVETIVASDFLFTKKYTIDRAEKWRHELNEQFSELTTQL